MVRRNYPVVKPDAAAEGNPHENNAEDGVDNSILAVVLAAAFMVFLETRHNLPSLKTLVPDGEYVDVAPEHS